MKKLTTQHAAAGYFVRGTGGENKGGEMKRERERENTQNVACVQADAFHVRACLMFLAPQGGRLWNVNWEAISARVTWALYFAGLLMTVRTAHGRRLDDGVLRFAKRHQGHVNKQPILVLFSDDGRPSKETLYPAANAAASGRYRSDAEDRAAGSL